MDYTVDEYIDSKLNKITDVSFNEKRTEINSEAIINTFLDNIIAAKTKINKWAIALVDINTDLEGLTWLNNVNEEHLHKINTIISSIKDLHSTLIRRYVSYNSILRPKGIAKDELNAFKKAIDDLKEICADLESVFFFLPAMPDFSETRKALSLI